MGNNNSSNISANAQQNFTPIGSNKPTGKFFNHNKTYNFTEVYNYTVGHVYDEDVIKELEILIKTEKFNINSCDKNEQTLLHFATKHSYMTLFEMLLKNGASVNQKDRDGKTPIFYSSSDSKCSTLLIKHGANLNIRDNDDHLPLYYIAQSFYKELIDPFLDAGATIDIEYEFEPRKQLHMAVLFRNIPLMKKLMENNPELVNSDINQQRWFKKPALYIACINSYYDEFLCLIEYGATIGDNRNNYLQIMLDCIKNESSVKIFRELIKMGADVNQKCIENTSLLHNCYYGSINNDKSKYFVEIIDMLVENGVSITSKTNNNEHIIVEKDPITGYIKHSNIHYSRLCLFGGEPLHYIAEFSLNLLVFEAFFRNGANPNAPNQFGITPFMTLFLESIFTFWIRRTCKEEQDNGFNIVKLFLDNGADIYTKDHFGRCALDYICAGHYCETVKTRIIKYLHEQNKIKSVSQQTNEIIAKYIHKII